MTTAGTPRGEGISHEEERRSETYYRTRREEEGIEEESAQIVTGGSAMEIIFGAGAATLGILGLAGVLPVLFITIGIMAAGVGLMFAGGSIAAKYRDILSTTGERRGKSSMSTAAGGGVSAETLGGAGGAVLGLLALIGVEPLILTSIALIVLGGALMFGAGATKRLANVVIEGSGAPMYKQRVANESVKGAAAAQTVLGLGAAALGILTLINVGPQQILNLCAVIALGAGLLISGLAVGGKMVNTLYRERREPHERHMAAE